MKLYVETNFLLEIALEQAEHAECSAILAACGDPSREFVLAVPASAFFEAQSALRNKRRHVSEFIRAYDVHVSGQLSRITGIAKVRASYDDVLAQLTASLNAAESRFFATCDRVREIGEILPTDARALEAAQDDANGLAYEDALIFATIRADPDYGEARTCFVSTDSDFVKVKHVMAAEQCSMLRSFRDAAALLGRPSSADQA